MFPPFAPKSSFAPTFQEVDVPNDNSCLFWCAALASLLPTLNDVAAFDAMYQKLFGNNDSFPSEDEAHAEIMLGEVSTKEKVRSILQTYNCRKKKRQINS